MRQPAARAFPRPGGGPRILSPCSGVRASRNSAEARRAADEHQQVAKQADGLCVCNEFLAQLWNIGVVRGMAASRAGRKAWAIMFRTGDSERTRAYPFAPTHAHSCDPSAPTRPGEEVLGSGLLCSRAEGHSSAHSTGHSTRCSADGFASVFALFQ